MDEKAFELFVKSRSVGEGGYSDGYFEKQDVAHSKGGITVRGITTDAFIGYLKNAGTLGNMSAKSIYELQLSMLRGNNEAPVYSTWNIRDGAGKTIESVQIQTPLINHWLKEFSNEKIPGISTQELNNPSNAFFLEFMRNEVAKKVNTNLVPSLQYIFANLIFAGGKCYIFDSDKEWYSWSGGFKEYLRRKYNLKETNGKSPFVSDAEAKELNSIEYDVIQSLYDYAEMRFKKCNAKETVDRYLRGWLNGTRKQVENALSISTQKKSNNLKIYEFATGAKITFFEKYRKEIIASLAFLLLGLASILFIKKYVK